MKYLFERAFEKEFAKLNDKKLAQSILDIIENVAVAESIRDIKKNQKTEWPYLCLQGTLR